MLILNPNNTVSFSLFSQFPQLVCVMSTSMLGDFNTSGFSLSSVMKLLDLYQIPFTQFVSMQQIHGFNVNEVSQTHGGIVINNIDSLITQTPHLYLGVRTADCVPLFFYDPVAKIAGVAHAGWRGTAGRIAQTVINEFKKKGSLHKNIYAAIGPHIGACCYNVPQDRARLFLDIFQDDRVAFLSQGKWFVDLGMANKLQLLQSDVIIDHIDGPITCTSCQNNLYFSFRKEGSTYSEMLGFIGRKS